jgi:hypothetical protein
MVYMNLLPFDGMITYDGLMTSQTQTPARGVFAAASTTREQVQARMAELLQKDPVKQLAPCHAQSQVAFT